MHSISILLLYFLSCSLLRYTGKYEVYNIRTVRPYFPGGTLNILRAYNF